ncbi:hypothetical protein C8Q79DRAFT_637093 [Trametes meyenii]|nr:hypothetical protein C8Q79DRAFT_637093 [Trametes meyenii]
MMLVAVRGSVLSSLPSPTSQAQASGTLFRLHNVPDKGRGFWPSDQIFPHARPGPLAHTTFAALGGGGRKVWGSKNIATCEALAMARESVKSRTKRPHDVRIISYCTAVSRFTARYDINSSASSTVFLGMRSLVQ